MTLTSAAFYSRKTIKYGFLFLLVLIFGRVAWTSGTAIYKKIFPPPPAPPTVAFGKLPTLPFPDKPGLPTYTFTLQTPTGEFPKVPTTIPVYFMPQRPVTFLGLDEARTLARTLGYNKAPYSLTETIYRFEREGSASVLDVNTVNKTFSVSYNLEESPELLSTRPDSNQQALDAVKYFLEPGSLYTEELLKGEKTYQYFKAQPPELAETVSLSEANFIRVNLFRTKLDELPIMTPEKSKANVWFLISGDTSRDKQIVAGEYHYFPIDKTKFSTYPIKTAQAAWDELSQGRGYVAQQSSNNVTQIVIRRVYLGYYDSGLPQGFLQPIYVFEGDNNFAGYVPAVTDQYYAAPAIFTQEQPATQSAQPSPEATPTEAQ
jgi:hypothetical protein